MRNVCIIDNWSLESCAVLLEDGLRALEARELSDHSRLLGEQILIGSSINGDLPHHQMGIDTPSAYLGALSNVLTAIVLFDSMAFVQNGFERTWQRHTSFASRLESTLTPLQPPSTQRREFLTDLVHGGLAFYFFMAQQHGADLYLNPTRSTLVAEACGLQRGTYGEYVEDVLGVLDEEVRRKLQNSPSKILRMSALPNLDMPPILHLILANSSSREDILKVAFEMRELRSAARLRELIAGITVGECRRDTYAILVDEIRALILDLRRESFPKKKLGSVGVSWFFAYQYEIEKDVLDHRFRLFLRHLAGCRMEIKDAQEQVNRIMN